MNRGSLLRGRGTTVQADNPWYNYNAFNVYRRELAPGTVSLTGDRAQGDDSKHWANSTTYTMHMNVAVNAKIKFIALTLCLLVSSADNLYKQFEIKALGLIWFFFFFFF